MKKALPFAAVFFLLVSLSACSSPKEDTGQDHEAGIKNSPPQATKYLAAYTESAWLKPLDEIAFADARETEDGYSYQFKAGPDQTEKTLTYQKKDSGEYEGTMTVSLNGSDGPRILNIPKSFASHIDQLDFSIEPTKIINPDPIVELASTDKKIEIRSLETKTEDEIKASMEAQIIDAETKRCEKLENNQAAACMFSLIAKYRDSQYIHDELNELNMAEFLGGTSQAVLKSDLKACGYINDPDDKALCYEFAYQTLLEDCDSESGKAYRDCVRGLSGGLPSFKEQRLFCGYIKDEDMRSECQGTAPMEVCGEIEDEEQKNLCKINIVRTNNDIAECDKFDNNDYKQACFGIVGIGQNKPSYCGKIEDAYLDGLCRTKIAMNSDDKNICDGIKDPDAKDLCLGSFLTREEHISQGLCDSFNELFLKETCQLALAVVQNDPGKCADTSIIPLENQPLCYMGIAMKHQDPSVCEKIQAYNEYDREAVEKLKKACLEIGKDSTPAQNNEPAETDAEKLSQYPAVPDWMDCPTPAGAVLKNVGGGQTSGFYYYSPEARSNVGLEMRWWGPNFDQPYSFICRNAEGDKDGPFKTWNQDGTLSSEGIYKNGEFHGVIKEYANNTLHLLKTYVNGTLNGNYEQYCIKDGKNCRAGDIAKSGTYANGKKNGFWSTYKFGEFEFKEEYIDNEVTRDKDGRNIKYYSE
jgi:hypothetical protein